MFTILGMLVVIGAVVGGFLMEHGNMAVLVQPAELVIIGGAGLGTLLVANPLSVVIKIMKAALGTLTGGGHDKKAYLEILKMLHDLFAVARKQGLVKIEADVEEPEKSEIFKKYPKFLKDHHVLAFLCDSLRMLVSGGNSPFELDQLMELDMDVHHHSAEKPVSALSTLADSLPGLGIVAAVLGVVITMGALGGPPEEIGHKVAAALVGTFLGILLCYGFLGPLAARMTKINAAEAEAYHCIRVAVVAFARGSAPLMAVEFGRHAIPFEDRPSFKEMEKSCKGGAVPAAVAA